MVRTLSIKPTKKDINKRERSLTLRAELDTDELDRLFTFAYGFRHQPLLSRLLEYVEDMVPQTLEEWSSTTCVIKGESEAEGARLRIGKHGRQVDVIKTLFLCRKHKIHRSVPQLLYAISTYVQKVSPGPALVIHEN